VSVSHFVTVTEDSAAPGSNSSGAVVKRLEEKLCIMEESMVSVVCCVCARTRLLQLIEGNETKYLMTGSHLTDCLTACSRVLLVKFPWLTDILSTFYQT
jgi:hypothetical protein